MTNQTGNYIDQIEELFVSLMGPNFNSNILISIKRDLLSCSEKQLKEVRKQLRRSVTEERNAFRKLDTSFVDDTHTLHWYYCEGIVTKLLENTS